MDENIPSVVEETVQNVEESSSAPALDDQEPANAANYGYLTVDEKGHTRRSSKEEVKSIETADIQTPVLQPQGQSNKHRISRLPPRKPIDIRFLDLSFSAKDGSIFSCRREQKNILTSLNGAFFAQQLTGILGPSGAGKSSLMNLLAGHREFGMTGKIKVNGYPRNLNIFRKLSCYIQQDERLLGQFTVMESMLVSAHLNLPKNTLKQHKLEIIEEVLTSLDLLACTGTRIDKLSGGQRKRTAIALELINNPPVMFFDEPTSGLDSLTSFQVVKLLKSFAKQGKNVICTIHQPSAKIFELFDKIYVMASGRCIFNGSVNILLPFLKQHGLNCPQYHNPADYVIEVASLQYGANVLEQLAQSVKEGMCDTLQKQISVDSVYSADERNKLLLPAECSLTDGFDQCKVFTNSFFVQFFVLLKRSFIGLLRDKLLTHIRFVSQIVIAVLIGVLFLGIGNDAEKVLENAALLFFTIMYSLFAALMPTVLTFPVEMAVFLREHMNCWYSLPAYYLARTLADIPLQIIFPIFYCVIVYFMTNQPPEAFRFVLFTLWTILTAVVAESLGLLLGAASPSVQVATFLGPITTIPVLLFCGFFVRFNNLPYYLRWMGYLAYVRYGFEGTIVSIYGYNRSSLECSSVSGIGCQFANTTVILEEMDVKQENLPLDAIALFVFFAGFRMLGYLLLRIRVALER